MARDFAEDLLRTLTAYTEEAQQRITESMTALGAQAKARLQSESPHDTGKYARGWRLKQSISDGQISITLKQSGQNGKLTHLLEGGHKTRGGSGFVHAQPHISTVQEWLNDEAEKAIEKAVSG